jgi:hypothetical protein
VAAPVRPLASGAALPVRRRTLGALLALSVLALPGAGACALRDPVLRAAGAALVQEDALSPADVVVIATDAGPAGVLEAADLVHAGLAPRVAVFADPPDPADREFLRRGVPYEDVAGRSLRQLRALGVAAVEVIPRAVAGSEDEGRVLPEWCEERGWRSVVVVSSSDHTRRLRRVLRRSMDGRGARVAVRAARHSRFDPDTWWHTRDGVRTEAIELQKLLLDVARHPLS